MLARIASISVAAVLLASSVTARAIDNLSYMDSLDGVDSMASSGESDSLFGSEFSSPEGTAVFDSYDDSHNERWSSSNDRIFDDDDGSVAASNFDDLFGTPSDGSSSRYADGSRPLPAIDRRPINKENTVFREDLEEDTKPDETTPSEETTPDSNTPPDDKTTTAPDFTGIMKSVNWNATYDASGLKGTVTAKATKLEHCDAIKTLVYTSGQQGFCDGLPLVHMPSKKFPLTSCIEGYLQGYIACVTVLKDGQASYDFKYEYDASAFAGPTNTNLPTSTVVSSEPTAVS
ncbi:hypothetical protein HDU67_005827, partial [Dinochytrium kinnereticum]